MQPKQMTFSAPIELRASAPGGLPSKLSGVAYSGAAVAGRGVIIDVDSTEVVAPMQLLFEHGRVDCIGVVESATKQGGQIVIAGKLFSDLIDSQGRKVAELAQRGAPFELSVGLFGYDEEYVGRGQRMQVNGRSVEGPISVLRNGRVREVSVVALGADPAAKAKLFGRSQQPVIDTARIYRRHNNIGF